MYLKTKISVRILYCMVLFASCKNADKKKNSEEKDVRTAKTATEINIPGTRVYMVPPAGFKPATGTMKGFIKDEETTFLSVMEIGGRSFQTEIATHSPERIREQGNSIFLEKETSVGEYKGRLMRIGDNETSTVWQLIFGDDSLSVMIMGIYPSHDEISGKQIAEAIETVRYDKDMIVDEKAALVYTIKTNESNFEYLKMQGPLAFYSLDGNTDIKSGSIPFVVVTQVARQNGTAQSFAETSLESVLRNGFTNPVVKSKGFLTINGNSAYEMEVQCMLKGRSVTVYIVVIVKVDTAVMVQGLDRNNLKKTMQGYKDFADAIVIK